MARSPNTHSSPRHRSPPKIVFVEEPLDTAEFSCPPTPLSHVPRPAAAPQEPASSDELPAKTLGVSRWLSVGTLLAVGALLVVTSMAF